MEFVRNIIKDICWVRVVLILSFLSLLIYPSVCGATGLKDTDTALINPDKKFINHYFNATEFHRKGELDKALEEYKNAYEYDPSNIMILNCIGRVYWKKGELDEAVAVYHQVLTKSNDRDIEAKARSSLGIIYMDQGKYNKALEELQRGLDIEPEPGRQFAYKTIINKCKAEMD